MSATNKGTPAVEEKKIFNFEEKNIEDKEKEAGEDENDPFKRAGTFHGRDAS